MSVEKTFIDRVFESIKGQNFSGFGWLVKSNILWSFISGKVNSAQGFMSEPFKSLKNIISNPNSYIDKKDYCEDLWGKLTETERTILQNLL